MLRIHWDKDLRFFSNALLCTPKNIVYYNMKYSFLQVFCRYFYVKMNLQPRMQPEFYIQHPELP